MTTYYAKRAMHRIERYREQQGYSTECLATRANVPLSVYQNIMQGMRDLDDAILERLAKALGISTASILDKLPTVEEFFEMSDEAPKWIVSVFERIEGEAANEGRYWMDHIKHKYPEMGDIMQRMIEFELQAQPQH